MKIIISVAMILMAVSLAFASTGNQLLTFQTRIGFIDGKDTIAAHRVLEGNKVLIIGRKNLQVWDYVTGKLLSSVPHEIDQFAPHGFFSKYVLLNILESLNWKEFVVDPKGRWMVTVEKAGSDKTRSAVVRELSTLKQIAKLDLPGFSIDRISLDAAQNELQTYGRAADKGGFASWDMETFRSRQLFSVDEYKWHDLFSDGKRMVVGSGDTKSAWFLFDVKEGNSLTLRDVSTGGVIREFTGAGFKPDSSFRRTTLSKDEKHLMSMREGRLFVWDIDGNGKPRFEIPLKSGDEEFDYIRIIDRSSVAVMIDEKVRIYDFAGNGAPILEIASATEGDTIEFMDHTANGRLIAVRDDWNVMVFRTDGSGKPEFKIERSNKDERIRTVKFLSEKNLLAVMRVNRSEGKGEWTDFYDVETGKQVGESTVGFTHSVIVLPNQDLLFDETIGGAVVWNLVGKKALFVPLLYQERDNFSASETNTFVPDNPFNTEYVALSPDSKYLLKYGEDVVSVFSIEEAIEVQRLFDADRVKYDKKTGKVKKSGLGKAAWTPDGKYAYALDSKSKTLSFWKVY